MLDPAQVLACAAGSSPGPAARPTAPGRVLVLGGAGALGSAVLERLLALHRFDKVGVVVIQPIEAALRGLSTLSDDTGAWAGFGARSAVIIFDRSRHAQGREDAFLRPQPAGLAGYAKRLHEAGVHALLVAMPHRAALLPQALRAGLANLDEAGVAALGFEQLVFMRLATSSLEGDAPGLSALQRLANGVLSQLHWMIPSAEQPVRASTVARVVAELLLAWPEARGGTRILPQALLGLVAQGGDAAQLLRRWLADESLPTFRAPRQRW
jgi:nucleoside-diphosphate-sugar epimerase